MVGFRQTGARCGAAEPVRICRTLTLTLTLTEFVGASLGICGEAIGRLARPERFELPTTWFEAKCSIQLSYGRVGRILAVEHQSRGSKNLSPRGA
jgi:hypothetical protein